MTLDNIPFILSAQTNRFLHDTAHIHPVQMVIPEGLDGGSWYSLITKNLAIYSLSLKFWLIH